jgi:Dyp-type peroxidase family
MKINNEKPISKRIENIEETKRASSQSESKDYAKLFEDIQGNILKSHARPHVKLLFLQFEADKEDVKEWIRKKIVPLVTPFSDQLKTTEVKKHDRTDAAPQVAQRALVVDRDPLFCNFLITSSGFKKLDLELPDNDGETFEAGMENRISSDPPRADWEAAYQHSIDALLLLANDHQNTIEQYDLEIRDAMQGIAKVVATEIGEVITGRKMGLDFEHFGFADGISQPRFFKEDLDGKDTTKAWDPFASLDLVLLKDPNGKTFVDGFTGEPVPSDNGEFGFGSYMVFRKLEQNVRGWNEAVARLADEHGIEPEWLGAMAVGRFKDGTPTILGGKPGSVEPLSNDFNYAVDKKGLLCPFHAHIRKTNPREESAGQFGITPESERAHRIARRGIPYGTPAGPEQEQPSENVGLLFMCFQSSISNQFEFMQQNWADNETFLNKTFNQQAANDTGLDGVIGQTTGQPINQTWGKKHGVDNDFASFSFGGFVKLKGGEYFFAPSISALKNL